MNYSQVAVYTDDLRVGKKQEGQQIGRQGESHAGEGRPHETCLGDVRRDKRGDRDRRRDRGDVREEEHEHVGGKERNRRATANASQLFAKIALVDTRSPSLFAQRGVVSGPHGAHRERVELNVYTQRDGVLPRAWPAPEVSEVKPGDELKGKTWSVRVVEVNHVPPHLVAYAYRLETSEGSFVYSGDTGPIESMDEVARDCDVLVHMCHFISGTAPSAAFAEGCMGDLKLAELGRRAKVKNLVLTHITTQMDQPGVREKIVGEMAQIYKGNLFFGEDLMQIPLKGLKVPKLD